jgi:hypothetical protein
MKPSRSLAVFFSAMALPSCSREPPSPAPSNAPAPATAAPPPANDGTNAKAPVLSPDDANFTDPRKGFGWGDRCFKELKDGKLGWARAACDRALALPEVDPKAQPALLFNEGLIAEKSGDSTGARSYFTQSLALRSATDPGRATVEKELIAVGGTPPPVTVSPAVQATPALVCEVVPAPPGYAGITVGIDWKSMSGSLTVAYKDIPSRHFKAKVNVWPSGCPWVHPMPDSPVCHGALRDVILDFMGYDRDDAKPEGERLVAGKSGEWRGNLGRVVDDPPDGRRSHFEFGDWAPAVPVSTPMECMQVTR